MTQKQIIEVLKLLKDFCDTHKCSDCELNDLCYTRAIYELRSKDIKNIAKVLNKHSKRPVFVPIGTVIFTNDLNKKEGDKNDD